MKKLYTLFTFFTITIFGFSQLEINSGFTNEELLEWIEGAGIEVSNLTVDCGEASMGLFTNPDFDNGLDIVDGILMTTGLVMEAIGPNDNASPFGGSGINGDDDLAMSIEGYSINDVCRIEFDAVPEFDNIIFSYVFASEEYEEWVDSPFNDVFGFFISGPGIEGEFSNGAANFSIVPGTDLPVSVNNLNQNLNSDYYVFNGDGTYATEPYFSDAAYCQFDGLSVNLPGLIVVEPNENYHFKIVIGDVSDSALDSGIFLQRQSLMSVTFTDVPRLENSPLTVFPNPCQDFIYINSENMDQIQSVEIINIEGRVVKVSSDFISHPRIDISELESGSYFLKIMMNNGEMTTSSIIKS